MRCATTLLFCILASAAIAQQTPVTGKALPDFPVKKILNYTTGSSSFSKLKKGLTIIDFFGTWCIPCIKALPHLKELQGQYKDKVQILLVSIEEEEKLKRFIAARKDFAFPVAVDTDNTITNIFNPPSYPFTVILDREGRLITTITDAKELTPAAIDGWLAKEPFTNSTSVSTIATQKPTTVSHLQKSTNSIVQTSQDFIYAAKTGESLDNLLLSLQNTDYKSLTTMLKTDAEKNAFWINIYNGFSNSLLKKNPDQYKDRNKFFKTKQVPIAGQLLSLDEIEHDFLRRTKIKWSLGHLNKLFPSKRAKELRVEKVDYRIHFALNCGAKSCPPIAYYSPELLENQLELATKNYLNSEVEYKKEEGTIYLPAIMSWFRADFGGKKGMKAILRKHGLLTEAENPKISFKKYDWTLELNNYKTE